jgi:uncharacterized membrane protein YfcA
MQTIEIIALIVSGIFVGFINTLAGGGSIISLSVLMLLGLPANIANGTNRIGILIQNITAVSSFKQQKVLETRKGFLLAIPAVIGSIIGSMIAVDLNEEIFERAIAIIMIVMMFFILAKPQKFLYGKKELIEKKLSVWQFILFFFIGIYGGFIQLGIGYFLIAGITLGLGYDLVRTNAIKVLIVLIYTPFTLLVFIYNDQINWTYGLILTIGTFIGSFIASRMAVNKGVHFVKWVIIAVILLVSAHLFDIINIQETLGLVIKK